MPTDSLENRRRALEAVFFAAQDRDQLERLRALEAQSDQAQALARACGVSDPQMVTVLLEQGVRAETLAVLMLVPLLAVAWADDRLSVLERRELLAQARELGIEADSPGAALLERWSQESPAPQLLEAWLSYTRALAQALDPVQRGVVAAELLGRARQVARADGGVLRIGRLISPAERRVLSRLEQGFEDPVEAC